MLLQLEKVDVDNFYIKLYRYVKDFFFIIILEKYQNIFYENRDDNEKGKNIENLLQFCSTSHAVMEIKGILLKKGQGKQECLMVFRKNQQKIQRKE